MYSQAGQLARSRYASRRCCDCPTRSKVFPWFLSVPEQMLSSYPKFTFHSMLLMRSSQFSHPAAAQRQNSPAMSEFFPLLHTSAVRLHSSNLLHFPTLHLASSPPTRRTSGYSLATFRIEKFVFLTPATLNVALLTTPFFFF